MIKCDIDIDISDCNNELQSSIIYSSTAKEEIKEDSESDVNYIY